MAGLLAELWLDVLIGDAEEFFQNDIFLSHGVDMSFAVDNDRINFAYKGPRPGITKNFRTNGTTVLPVHDRTDTPDYLDLDNYSTDQFLLPRVDLFGLPYDKRQSLVEDSRAALIDRIATEGLWAIAPDADSAKTPVIKTPIGNDTNTGDNYKKITDADILKLRLALDKKYPGLKNSIWMLRVDTDTYWDLVATNSLLRDQYAYNASRGNLLSGDQQGSERMMIPLTIYNFTIWADDRGPWYDADDDTLLAYNPSSPTFTVGTDLKSAVAYVPQKTFCTALGSAEVFETLRDSGKQADLVSYLIRASVTPWGQTAANHKHMGAILRTPA